MKPTCRSSQRLARAFTLVEMLVVIGVLVLIMAAIAPMLGKATKSARRARVQSDLQVIGQALESYRTDHRDYPRYVATDPIAPTISGAELLCWALMAPGPATGDVDDVGAADGKDGLGFRIRGTQGQAYGP